MPLTHAPGKFVSCTNCRCEQAAFVDGHTSAACVRGRSRRRTVQVPPTIAFKRAQHLAAVVDLVPRHTPDIDKTAAVIARHHPRPATGGANLHRAGMLVAPPYVVESAPRRPPARGSATCCMDCGTTGRRPRGTRPLSVSTSSGVRCRPRCRHRIVGYEAEPALGSLAAVEAAIAPPRHRPGHVAGQPAPLFAQAKRTRVLLAIGRGPRRAAPAQPRAMQRRSFHASCANQAHPKNARGGFRRHALDQASSSSRLSSAARRPLRAAHS
jgi:hypothetical protein